MDSMNSAPLCSIDAFSALLAELHDLHKREVADLNAKISSLMSTAVWLKQKGAGNLDAPNGIDQGADMVAPPPSSSADFGLVQQQLHVKQLPDTSFGAEESPVEPVYPSGDCSENRESRLFPSTASGDNRAIRSSDSASIADVIRRTSKKLQRIGLDQGPSGLAAIRKRPSHNAQIDCSSWSSFLTSLVKQSWFEAFFCVLIFLNACVVAVEVQMKGAHLRDTLWSLPVDTVEREQVAHPVIEALSWIFGVLFALEVVIKMLGWRSHFGLDYWNWIDLMVCVAWTASELEGDYLPVNSQVLRLFRLARLLRLLRLVRTVQGFDHLFIMTSAIRGSFSVLFWTCVLLSLVQLVVALFLIQYLQDQYFDVNAAPDSEFGKKQQAVFEYFGTFTRAFFSTFEMTLANWPPACRVLAENVSEWFFVFAVFYKLSMGFAVIGVVNGVFIQETFRVASIDDHIMMRQKARALKAHRDKMLQLFEEADGAHDKSFRDGLISREEWLEIIQDERVKLWLASMELVAADATKLFDLMDETQDGFISFDELTMGVARLRGNARSIDMAVLMHDQHKLRKLVESIIKAALVRPTPQDFTPPTFSSDQTHLSSGGKLDGKALQPIPMEEHPVPKDELGIHVRHMVLPCKGANSGVPDSSPASGTHVLHAVTRCDQ